MAKKKILSDEIELHGLRHKPALELVRKTLEDREVSGTFSLTVITGNSSVLQERIFTEILDDSPYDYYIPSWNLGQIIVAYQQW